MLTRCPSCQASVLDDDAEVCPFCGSPMDPAQAKDFQPATKPAEKSPPRAKSASSAAPPVKEKRTAAKSEGSSSGKSADRKSSKSAAATATRKSSDDPFAVDPASISGVIPLASKPSQKRPKKIDCPMCDTAGYAPVSASGKEVRCPNRSCMVPVFTAPDFAAPKREAVEAPSSKGAVLTVVGIAIVVLGGGFAYWWLNFRVPDALEPSPIVATDGEPTTPVPDEPAESDGENAAADGPATVAPPAATPAEVRARAFAHWPKLIDTIVEIGRRPERLRYAAESYAIAGNLEQARAQLAKIEEENRLYKIGPLAEIAFAELNSGDAAAAKADFQTLAGLRDAIPTRGFDPARSAIHWSAAAAQSGDANIAHGIAQSEIDDDAGEELLASLASAATLANYDLDANHAWRPVIRWTAPKSVAVAYTLIRHGQADTAQAWAEGAEGKYPELARTETLAAWAEGTVRRDGAAGVETIRQATAALDPAAKLYVLSRAALRAIASGDAATAESLFTDIESAGGAIAASEALSAATAGELHEIDLSETAIERLRGAAFAEAAHVAAALKKTDLANTYLWRGVDHFRALAPPAVDVNARNQEYEAAGLAGIRRTLQSQLSLSDNQAQEAATDYRRKLPTYRAVAGAAREAQATILARGIRWGLGTTILKELQARDAAAGEGRKFLAGQAGGRVWAAFQQSGNSEAAATVRAAGVSNRDVPLELGMELVLWPLIAEGKFAAAGEQITSRTWSQVPDDVRLSLAMRVVARLAGKGQQAQIAEFLSPINRRGDLDELYRLWAARAAAGGHGMGFLDQLERTRRSITTQAAALRGLTAGLETRNETNVKQEPAAKETAMVP